MTWASPRCVQELATFLGHQNRTQGCGVVLPATAPLAGTLVIGQ